jgi:hypothetical protein
VVEALHLFVRVSVAVQIRMKAAGKQSVRPLDGFAALPRLDAEQQIVAL